MNRSMIIALAFAGSFFPIRGEEQSLPPPTAPAVRTAPSFAAWTVTFDYQDENRSKPDQGQLPPQQQDRVKSISIRKTNTTYAVITEWKSGRKSEKWNIGGLQFQTAPDSKVVAFLPRPESSDFAQTDYLDFSQGDFPELTWISLKDYSGIQTFRGKPSYLFAGEKNGQKLSALLSDRQLPLQFSSGAAVLTYTMNPPPTAALTPPENFLRVLADYQKGKEALKRQPSPP